jgi:hypothetical protein
MSPKQALPRKTCQDDSSTDAGSPEAHQRHDFQIAGLSDEALGKLARDVAVADVEALRRSYERNDGSAWQSTEW